MHNMLVATSHSCSLWSRTILNQRQFFIRVHCITFINTALDTKNPHKPETTNHTVQMQIHLGSVGITSPHQCQYHSERPWLVYVSP